MRQFQVTKWLLKHFYLILILLLTFLVVLILWYSQITEQSPPEIAEEVVKISLINQPIQPIPPITKVNTKKVVLGEKLFNEKELSDSNNFSCATCHNLHQAGVDRSVSLVGIKGIVGPINIPTVFNSKFNFKQFWDGSAETLADQIEQRVSHTPVMNSNWLDVIHKLQQSPEYTQDFAQIYPDGITINNVKDAIATFEETLITPNSRFDKFLLGDINAITSEEKKGYLLFKSYGCINPSCGLLLSKYL